MPAALEPPPPSPDTGVGRMRRGPGLHTQVRIEEGTASMREWSPGRAAALLRRWDALGLGRMAAEGR
jgi:hypothetical protein